ncbi:HNH endonuclease signature motif containing protein [uncultured Arthrobacter sp.]|uniref:HNH endonuclease signature motif containing protein n=1 Tax=uncultured Arthrobacter sp. TaxID=114050 RepID=UPI00262A4AE5|nr:HNH endonuclease signature motif containing protein [uncultured Arthrobacter sp.]
MGIGAAETVQTGGVAGGLSAADEYERVLAAAYAGADLPVMERPLTELFCLEWADEFDDPEAAERARAAWAAVTAADLARRLQDVPSTESYRILPDTLELLRTADRLASWVASRQALLIAEVFHRIHKWNGDAQANPGHRGSDPQLSLMLAAQEITPVLRVPGRTAQRMLDEALRLTGELPETWEALDAGRISPTQASVIVDESGSIPAEAVAGFEETVLETAGDLTRPKLTRRCRRLREELHPESIIDRKARAVKDRHVEVQPEQDGMAWLSAYLPAEQAHGIFNRVDAAARSLQGPDEGRTLSQLRADVFADVLTHTCTGDPKRGTGYRGVGASVFVTVPVMTLLGHQRKDWQNLHGGAAGTAGTAGAADAAGAASVARAAGAEAAGAGTPAGVSGAAGTRGPARSADAASAQAAGTGADDKPSESDTVIPDLAGCENGLLEGYGPIDPETARNLAAHAPSFTRILVHPETGAVLSVGRDRYRPPKHLQDWVRITNPTCIHPGCNRSSWSCEIDHVTPWAHGGKTALDNLKPRCKLHHMLKTEGIWPVGHDDDEGTPNVTSPGEQTYTTLPEPPPPF